MKKKISLRLQILIILIVFIALVLGLIFIFQTAFLDSSYKKTKIKTIENTAHEVIDSFSRGDVEDIIDALTTSNEVCVRVISNETVIEGYNHNTGCALGRLDNDMINILAIETIDNGGEKLFENYKFISPNREESIYIYGQIEKFENNFVFVLVSSMVTPLDATIETIKNQYVVIAIVVVLATVLLALLLSRIILKPVKEINNEAKNLPNGTYDGQVIKSDSKELNELNETLVTANEEILKADKAKKELLSNVSHDLRTPLTMIVGYGEMIRDIKEENNEDNINVIIDEAKRLNSLVDDLLDISRFENKDFKLNKENVSLNNLLESVYHQYNKYCESQGVKLELKTIEDVTINVDVHRIKQVLYNFINNSLNYMEKENGLIIIGDEKINDIYRVYVYDNGLGIDEDKIDKIWERYYKIDKEHKRYHLGSGIGLSLSKDILDAHELNYGVESKKGEYSKFYFDVKSV